MYINNPLKKEKQMETRKKVNQKPKSNVTFTIIVTSILKTLWAIGTSVAAAGVLPAPRDIQKKAMAGTVL